MEAHGRDAVAVYIGNPAAHGLAPLLYGRVLLKALGTRSVYSASTVDQRPKEIASGLMYGAGLSVAIPDVDRTQHLLMLGANPLASNGSLMTAPDMRGQAEGAAGARRQAGRRRPAPQPHRRGGRRAPPDPPRHRRAPAVRARARAVRGGPRARPAGSPGWPTGSTRCASWRSRSRRRPLRPSPASTPARSGAWRASWPPPSRRPSTAGSGRRRRSSARSRPGSSTCSTC